MRPMPHVSYQRHVCGYEEYLRQAHHNRRWLVTGGHAREGEFVDQALRQYLLGNTIVLENMELFHAAIGRLCRKTHDIAGIWVAFFQECQQ